MRYIFYADIYFVQNFMMKVAVLYLSLYCNKIYFETTRLKYIVRISLISFLATIIEILGLMMSGSYNVFVICVHLLEIPLMTGLALGKNRRQMLRVILSGYFFTMLINSILEALWNQLGERGGSLFFLIFSCGAVIVGVRIWKNYMRIQKGVYTVELGHKGKEIRTQGFYDSGNRLVDPYTKKGVQIVSRQLFEELLDKKAIDEASSRSRTVFIPYQSLGNEADLLEVYYIDKLIIEAEEQRIKLENCPLGVTKDNLFKGKNYEIILNEEVF